jgi:predicted RNA binding protein YcfA (HicA-like mRNA interferase family)
MAREPRFGSLFSQDEGKGGFAVALVDGWYLVATKGSHRQFKHPTKSGRVTVAGKPGDNLAAGTLGSILKQAGLKQ